MTLITNPNFADRIVKAARAEGKFEAADVPSLNLLVELELRHLVEAAIRFMTKDARDVLQLDHVLSAAKHLDHTELIPETACASSRSATREDSLLTAKQIVEEGLEWLGEQCVGGPRLQGRWLFLKGKVPTLNKNISFRSMTQCMREQEQAEHRLKFLNVIKDDPYSLLTKDQALYFEKMCTGMAQDVNPEGNFTVEGDLNNLTPFFLKFLAQGELNDTAAQFLLKLIDNPYVWRAVEFYLNRVLRLLLGYRGQLAFQVGAKIALLVDRFAEKYPMLRDIYENYTDDSYSTLLKKIPFELHLGVPLRLDERLLRQCKEDSGRGDRMALLCMQALLSYAGQLSLFREYLQTKMNTFVYWHPCPELRDDPYLRMF